MGLENLPQRGGFATDFRAPRICQLALDVANELGLAGDFVARAFKRATLTPDAIFADVCEYDRPALPNLHNDKLWDRAVERVASAFRLPVRVQPIHLKEVLDEEWNLQSNSGPPYYARKREVKVQSNYDARRLAHMIKHSHFYVWPDAAAFARAHISEAEEEDKVRAVWGLSFSVLQIEAMFANPLIAAYKIRESPLAWNFAMLRGGMMRVYHMAKPGSWYHCFDFKKFDKTVQPWLIRAAFDILKQNIDLSHYRSRGTGKVEQLSRLWDAVVLHFIHTRVIFSDGRRVRKHLGVPSGSMFTQIIDSICNALVMNYCFLVLTDSFYDDGKFLGDDSFIVNVRRVEAADVKRIAEEKFGMILNLKPSKSIVTQNITEVRFLGYYCWFGTPFKPTVEFLAAMIHPERPDVNCLETKMRAVGNYWANVNGNRTISLYLRTLVRRCDERITAGDLAGVHKMRKFQEYLEIVLGSNVVNLNKLPDDDELVSHLWEF